MCCHALPRIFVLFRLWIVLSHQWFTFRSAPPRTGRAISFLLYLFYFNCDIACLIQQTLLNTVMKKNANILNKKKTQLSFSSLCITTAHYGKIIPKKNVVIYDVKCTAQYWYVCRHNTNIQQHYHMIYYTVYYYNYIVFTQNQPYTPRLCVFFLLSLYT